PLALAALAANALSSFRIPGICAANARDLPSPGTKYQEDPGSGPGIPLPARGYVCRVRQDGHRVLHHLAFSTLKSAFLAPKSAAHPECRPARPPPLALLCARR